RIAVQNGRVQYSRNGQVLYESRKAPQYPLIFDAALGSMGATIRNARIQTNDNRAVSRNDAWRNRDQYGNDRYRDDRYGDNRYGDETDRYGVRNDAYRAV